MRFAFYGGFELPRRNGLINDTILAKNAYWADVNDKMEGLANACGCYIFSAQNIPWYVCLAARQSFQNECLTHHKVNIYNNVLAN